MGRDFSRLTLIALALIAACGPALAEDGSEAELDVTMRLIEDPDARSATEVTNRITLPAALRSGSEGDAAPGRRRGSDVANEARERARETGREMSQAAREMAERAAEDRGDFGRAKREELSPEPPPEEPPRPPRP